MDLLEDLEQQASKIISRSLSLTPPANYNLCDYPGFDLRDGNEWMGLLLTNDWNQMVLIFMNCLRIHLSQRRNFVYRLKKRAFEESTKHMRMCNQPVSRSENESERVVQLMKPHYCLSLKIKV